MKNKKLAIIISIALMVIVVVSTTLWLVFKENSKVRTTENTYTAYININPLIKLSFKVSCQNDDCTEPIITDTELINEDAKKVYKELTLENKSLKESIELLANTVKDNDIAFKEVHIYTNYDNENEFKIDSVDYEIKLDVKKDEELKQVIDELIIEDANKKTKEILVPIAYPRSIYDADLSCANIELLEHEELYVTKTKIFDSGDGVVPDLVYDVPYIKITVSGSAEVIDNLPDEYHEDDDPHIYAYIDITNLNLGTHNFSMQIINPIENVEVLTPSIESKCIMVSKDDLNFPLRAGI